ncbi:uncharacterized protein [Argopecten irradians]|uniref:uncharacterized protein n=1 Tax=Argopecten irradians TaxID=31199 RepID=UPI0037104329
MLSNVDMSSGWREPSTHVPVDLQHRPPHIIHHIRDATTKASDITSQMIVPKEDGCFDVRSPSNKVYRVYLGKELGQEMPKCQCKAFKRSHLPCKHLCAVISHCTGLSWNSLPSFYINNPLFVIDGDCVNVSIPPTSICSNDICPSTSAKLSQSSPEVVSEDGNSVKVGKLAKQVRDVLHYITSLSYICQSESTLNEVRQQLQSTADLLKGSCPKSGTLLLEQPAQKNKLSLKRKSSVRSHLKALPTRKKCHLTKKEQKSNKDLKDSVKPDEGMSTGKKSEHEINSNDSRSRSTRREPVVTRKTKALKISKSFDIVFSVSKEDVICRIKDMVKSSTEEDWEGMVEEAKLTPSSDRDMTHRVACAVLDECCPTEEQEEVLVELSKLAPQSLNVDSTLRLSFVLLHRLVKYGKFPLKRDLTKEDAESVKLMKDLIDSIRAMPSSSAEASTDQIPGPKLPSTDFSESSNSLPRKSILRLNKRSMATRSRKGAYEAKKVRFENTSQSPSKVEAILEELLAAKKNNIKGSTRLFTGGEVLEYRDIKTLTGRQWLNDKVINAYLTVLQREQNNQEMNHIFCIPSYLAVLWDSNRYDHWLFSKVKFSFLKWIFMPINVRGMHWVLLAADVQRGEVTVLDSMGGNNKNLAQKWMQYMQIRSAKTGELGNKIWTEGKLVSCRQEDGNACGAFVLLNATCLARGIDLSRASHQYAVAMRNFAMNKLISTSTEHPSHRKHCDMLGCQTPASAEWVQCAVCGRWSHLPCVNIASSPNEDFICPVCKAQYY